MMTGCETTKERLLQYSVSLITFQMNVADQHGRHLVHSNNLSSVLERFHDI
jgi:DNA helicase TIP49 (TBP-interacting protein)